MIDPRLELHDDNQLELKLAYVLEPGAKRQSYLVESFMFVPRTLGAGQQSYDANRFYADTATFVRMKTPSVALEALAKAGRAEQWFDPVRAQLDSVLGGRRIDSRGLVRSLKLLGAIYRTALRDEGIALEAEIAAFEETDNPAVAVPRAEAINKRLARFSEHTRTALKRLRRTGGRCVHAVIPEIVRETWAVVDEYVSIFAEETATTLVAAIEARFGAGGGPIVTARERLADLAIAAYHYRRTHSYPSYAIIGDSNEELPRRRRILKRIVSSVLYLDTAHEEGGIVQRDIIAGLAAALAMLFAIVVAVWAQLEWGILSSTFILMMVLSYIVKDRIKEWGKRYLGKRFSRWMPDVVVKVRDPQTQKVIGRSRESVMVRDPAQIDPAIRRIRHVDHPSTIAEHGRPEVVIYFVKDVGLDSKGLHRAMPGIEGLNDIIRFNFGYFRERMDQPLETYRMVHPTTRELTSVPCARVYHVNFVLRITRGRGARRVHLTERVRVVIDQSGIQRVERVDVEPRGGGVVVADPTSVRRGSVGSGGAVVAGS